MSQIRPKGSPVNNSALTSTGLVPFMERYSNSTREVAQDGRRGALMLSVSIKHPDSEAFIDAKMEEGKVTGANVSVKITDEFMQAAVADRPFVQQFPIDARAPMVSKTVSAKTLWGKIVHNAWKSAEPGVLFWDTILRESIPDLTPEIAQSSVYSYIEERLNTKILTSKRQITVELANEDDFAYLNLSPYNCVAIIESQTFSSEGLMFEFTQVRHHPDAFRYCAVSRR